MNNRMAMLTTNNNTTTLTISTMKSPLKCLHNKWSFLSHLQHPDKATKEIFVFYSGLFYTWCMLCIDCQETNAMQLPSILVFLTSGGVILHRSGGFTIHHFRKRNQGTTTEEKFIQRCTDVAFHGKGTRVSWQTLLLPASWFIKSPYLHCERLEVDWVWKRSHDHGKKTCQKQYDTKSWFEGMTK